MRRLAKVEAEQQAATLFSTPNEKIQLPEIKPAVARIIDRIFNIEVLDEYESIEKQLQIREALTPQVVRQALNCAENNARIAHQIYTVAKVEHERVKIDYLRIEAAMRDAAVKELTNDKAIGLRSKQVTEQDVKLRIIEMYPDEYSNLIIKRTKEDEILEHLKRLADLWQERTKTLKSLNKEMY